MAPRKASACATGGRMINPSVEPASRRESAQERRDSEGRLRRASARASSRESHKRPSAGGRDSASNSGSLVLLQGGDSTTSAAALQARNQRRSIGLKRLSVNTHMKDSLINTLEDVARDVRMGLQTTGIEKLQTIMTEAKEKGLGVSNLFHFFLLQSESGKRESMERKASSSLEKTGENMEPVAEKRESATGGLFKETESSKTRAKAVRTSKSGNRASTELMPSLKKGARPSTANSKRTSSDPAMNTARDESRNASGSSQIDDPATKEGDSSTSGRRRSSMSRRSSLAEEAMMRDRLITSASFQHGLTTLGFNISTEARIMQSETAKMFDQLDANGDGSIDLAEFTRFCLEIPSMTWKAERARRGILGNNAGEDGDRELEKAARDMANETVSANDAAEGGLGGELAKLEPLVHLGKIFYRGEKFFWRTKDLIEVVVQLNETKGFLAIPASAAAEAEILNDLKAKRLAAKTEHAMGGSGSSGGESDANKEQAGDQQQEDQALSEKAHMAYIADYIVHRITMPDGNGNLLQPDVTRPEEEVNPGLPADGEGSSTGSGATKTKRGSAAARPGLMRTTFDEWDTLLFPNPPSRVEGVPKFAETKKRESYFQEFCSVTEKFEENRVRAQRLSGEAAAFAMQVSNTLAPLGHSASSPATLALPESQQDVVGGDAATPRRGSGRIILADEISNRRGSGTKTPLLESQSAPALHRPSKEMELVAPSAS
ncbi:unnamed protein product [Ectocarpus sp. 6 AP-2014]